MDQFKKTMTKKCGVGGLRCRCCNDFMKSGTKSRLRRMARRIMKQEMKRAA